MTSDNPSVLRTEWSWLLVGVTAVLFLFFGSGWTADLSSPVKLVLIFVWLFVIILVAAFNVVRHADALAVILGEPLGTLVLTLSVITIEVLMISAVMLTGSSQPTLARDTMFAVAMIVMNGLIGLALLVGGLRHHEQNYNLRGANAYLAVILPLAVLGLVLPSFTKSTDDATLSTGQEVIEIIVFLALYIVFLAIQTVRHRDLFMPPKPALKISAEPGETVKVSQTETGTLQALTATTKQQVKPVDPHIEDHGGLVIRSIGFHAVMLLAFLIPVVVLSKQLAYPIDYTIGVTGAPVALGGFIVALLILSPEAMSGLRAAASNRLQRSVNLYLGSVAATIGLTVPAVLIIGLATGNDVILGLEPTGIILLSVTLAVSLLTFESRRTNVLHGAVHLVLFAAYFMLIFD